MLGLYFLLVFFLLLFVCFTNYDGARVQCAWGKCTIREKLVILIFEVECLVSSLFITQSLVQNVEIWVHFHEEWKQWYICGTQQASFFFSFFFFFFSGSCILCVCVVFVFCFFPEAAFVPTAKIKYLTCLRFWTLYLPACTPASVGRVLVHGVDDSWQILFSLFAFII